MLVLLPPSEGKTTPSGGDPLDITSLVAADVLTDTRRGIMEALVAASTSSDAPAILKLGPKSAEDALLNLALETAPAAPASQLYTGVLYDAAQMSELATDPATAHTLERNVLIFSALWGVLRPSNRIPDHRLAMGVKLPGIGALPPLWRPVLESVMHETWEASSGGVIVDCRSGNYVQAWKGSGELTQYLLPVTVESEDDLGQRKVVSHHAKHTRGLLAAALVRARAAGELTETVSAKQVLDIAGELPGARGAELSPGPNGTQRLTIVLPRST